MKNLLSIFPPVPSGLEELLLIIGIVALALIILWVILTYCFLGKEALKFLFSEKRKVRNKFSFLSFFEKHTIIQIIFIFVFFIILRPLIWLVFDIPERIKNLIIKAITFICVLFSIPFILRDIYKS